MVSEKLDYGTTKMLFVLFRCPREPVRAAERKFFSITRSYSPEYCLVIEVQLLHRRVTLW
jgi:hypothetical protein